MPPIRKQLHMASNLDQLKERSEQLNIGSSVRKNACKLTDGMKRLNEELQRKLNLSEQDEELIYFLTFRLLTLWQVLQLTDDYKSHEKFYKCMFGNNVNNALQKLEEMNISLKKRYETEIKNNIPEEKYTNIADVTESKPSEEILPQEERVSMSCKELFDKVLANEDIIIIDTRAESDFNSSRLSKGKLINIPNDRIKPGMSASMLRNQLLSEEDKRKWDYRGDYKQIIMLDWRTEEKTLTPGSTLHVLKNIFLKWDISINYKKKPLILEGGYEKFLDQYPYLTTNPNIEPPRINDTSSFVTLDEIVYPLTDLSESIISPIQSKTATPSLTLISTGRPSIDRSTKPEQGKPAAIITEMENESEPESENIVSVQDQESMRISPDISEMKLDPILPKHSTIMKRVEESSSSTTTTTPSVKGDETPSVHPKNTALEDIGDGDSDVSFTKLKSDDSISSSFSSGLKRSRSSPNIAQLKDDADIIFKAKPLIDRTSKPSPRSSDSFSPRSHGTVPRGLTGLKNLGNLCYMNSIIQCVSNTEELKKQLIAINTPCRINKESRTKGLVFDAVKHLICLLHQGQYRWVTCKELKTVVGQYRNTFAGYDQQDSHEFLTELMDWLHEDLNCPTPNFSLEGALESTGERAWGEFKQKNESIVLELFYGQLRSTITCCECRKQSVTFDPFSNLSLPLPMDKDRCRLSDCITLYLTGETILGWNCPRCKGPRKAVKKFDITRLPPVLVIHLKRFMTEGLGYGWSRKRPNMVDFPLEDLDMRQYAVNSEQRFHTYNLYAVSNHYGTMDSGHYTAYCKNYTYNKWFKFDDQEVVELSPLEVNSSAAYILFYSTVRS